ncbi:hypothetical protein [Psychrobacter sp.]|uniref:hypothetical protein n=1 Tax=Psychrobacter TaxID=497 RepID=UPI003C75FBCE
MSRKIPYALYSVNWSYDSENISELLEDSHRIVPSEYDNGGMRKKIFCPKCFTPLTRTPLEGMVSSNGISAFFKHLPSYNHIRCLYRAKRGEGLYYDNEEDALAAIENENLVIVSGFLQERPQQVNERNDEEYNDTLVEDINGPQTGALISRHRGREYRLPSKITTVRTLCRNFPDNLSRAYYLPNTNIALPLLDLLNQVEKVRAEDDVDKLYIGRIISSSHLGQRRDDNVRMTKLQFNTENTDYADFYVKTVHSLQFQHGISENSIGRYVIFYGRILESGVGLCVGDLGWGELALLPERYNEIAATLC